MARGGGGGDVRGPRGAHGEDVGDEFLEGVEGYEQVRETSAVHAPNDFSLINLT